MNERRKERKEPSWLDLCKGLESLGCGGLAPSSNPLGPAEKTKKKKTFDETRLTSRIDHIRLDAASLGFERLTGEECPSPMVGPRVLMV